MVQYSSDILTVYGAPELSDLTTCGAKALPELPNYLSSAIWNHIDGVVPRDPSVLHLDLAFARRADAAADAYRTGRTHLLRYVEGVSAGEHRLGTYLAALTHFEQCISYFWQAAELFDKFGRRILKADPGGCVYLT